MKPRVCRAKKTAPGTSEEIVWDIWKADIKKRGAAWHKTSWMGLRAASCAKHSNSQRGKREGKRAGQSGGGEREKEWSDKALVATRMHRRHTWVKEAEDVGRIVNVHHMHVKAGLFINAWLRGVKKSKGRGLQLTKTHANTFKFIA